MINMISFTSDRASVPSFSPPPPEAYLLKNTSSLDGKESFQDLKNKNLSITNDSKVNHNLNKNWNHRGISLKLVINYSIFRGFTSITHGKRQYLPTYTPTYLPTYLPTHLTTYLWSSKASLWSGAASVSSSGAPVCSGAATGWSAMAP